MHLFTRKRVLLGAALLILLAGAFWFGGNAPGLRGWTAAAPEAVAVSPAPPTPAVSDASSAPTAPPKTPAPTPVRPAQTPAVSIPPHAEAEAPAHRDGATPTPAVKDKYLTDPVPEGKPLPVEPEEAVLGDGAYTCTLSVRCTSILDHMDWLDPEKVELVPPDGVIFPPTVVTFYEGESVFNLLQREMRSQGIHMEFVSTPIYNSAYIEGIANLYEFDCGELSGWMYRVNDWFPNYGCSRYVLRQDDVVEWVYTCNLGADVGGHAAVGG